MLSSRMILTIVCLAYSFSNAQLLSTEDEISKWTTITVTEAGETFTQTGLTETLSASTVTYNDEPYGGMFDMPGVTPSPYTVVVPATTITREATTETIPVRTSTNLQAPEALVTLIVPGILYDMQSVAPDVTSLPVPVASKLNADFMSMWRSYTAKNPLPSIYSKVNSGLQAFYDTNNPLSIDVAASIWDNLVPFPDPTQTASISSALSSLLAPYPSLSSDISEYMTAIPVWEAPEYLAEISIIRNDLSITTPAPTWLSQVSAYLPTSTGTSAGSGTSNSSKNSAATTRAVSVLINAGIAAVGIVIIGLM